MKMKELLLLINLKTVHLNTHIKFNVFRQL